MSNRTPGLGGSGLPLPDRRASTGVPSEWALLLVSSPPSTGAPVWGRGMAGPGGFGTLGSRTSRSLGRRAPGAPGLEPEG